MQRVIPSRATWLLASSLILSTVVTAPVSSATDFWTPLTGFEGGPVYAVATGALGLVFAGTWGYGVYRSQDSGAHWYPVAGLPLIYIDDIAVAPNGHVFATGSTSTYQDGLYRSTDNGDSWAPVSGAPSGIASIAASPGGTLFGGGAGLYRSLDDGLTWTLSLSNGNVILTEPSGTVYVAAGTSLSRSTTNGDSWTTIVNVPNLSEIRDIAVDESSNTIYASTYSDGLHRTTDDGATFPQIYPDNGGTHPLLVLPDHTVLLATYSGIIRSSDGGDTWTPTTGSSATTVFARDPAGKIFTGTEAIAVYSSMDNGQSWGPCGSGIYLLPARTVGAFGNESLLANDGVNRIQVSNDLGVNWSGQRLGAGPPWLYVATPSAVLTITASGVFRSTDGGVTWPPSNQGLSSVYLQGTIRLRSGAVLVGTANASTAIYRSEDDGLTWIPSDSGIDQHVSVFGQLPDGTVLAAAPTGIHGSLFESVDDGHQWTSVVPITSIPVIDAMAANSQGVLFAASGGGPPYKSTNGGLSWKGIPVPGVNAVLVDPLDRVYLGASDGVYRSLDGAAPWEKIASGMEGRSVSSLVITPSGYFVAGTDRGAFRSTTPIVGVERGVFTGGLAIQRVGPNPGPGDQRIAYTLNRPGKLRMNIYDVAGRCVRTTSWMDDAGVHERPAFERAPAPGLYLIELEQDGRRARARAVVVR